MKNFFKHFGFQQQLFLMMAIMSMYIIYVFMPATSSIAPVHKVHNNSRFSTISTSLESAVSKTKDETINESNEKALSNTLLSKSTVSTQTYEDKAKFYKEMYGPKPDYSKITIDEYTFDVIPGAPYSVYEDMAASERVAEEARIAEEKRLAEEAAKKKKAAAAAKKQESIQTAPTQDTYVPAPSGCLTKSAGVFNGPSGKETYYNLNMNGVVSIMRNAGFSEEEYPYWVREDGVKMLGPYVMVAANLSLRPRGSLVQSSLGMAIVCDTGGFAASNPTQLDIAVSW